jgi:hypothetical protein
MGPVLHGLQNPVASLQDGPFSGRNPANAAERAKGDPLLDWLQASTQWNGVGVLQRTMSVLEQPLEPTSPPPRVVTWMQTKLEPYWMPQAPGPGNLGPGIQNPPPVLQERAATAEYSPLEIETIQAECGITDAEWETRLPPLYDLMLQEGRAVTRVKAVLMDLLRPMDLSR